MVVALSVSGCTSGVETTIRNESVEVIRNTAVPAPPASTAPPSARCPYPASGFDCAQQLKFAAAEAYLRTRPGFTGIVVRDRKTGALWRNEHAAKLVWTASTIKLAIAVDLLLREKAGKIQLTTGDRTLLRRMLRSSDDLAANALWKRFDGVTASHHYPSYGLAHLTFPQVRKWGSAKTTTEDLEALMTFALDKVPADVRDYILTQLRHVAPNQQWGVWGAGPAQTPANKDGWFGYSTGWVMNSVGTVGPGERYTVALMNDLQGEGGYDDGQATTTRVAKILFAR
jgi:hypothetical protein